MAKVLPCGMLRLIIAPNGVAYAPPEARPGILPRLLQEILSTRIMVKAAMKRAPKSAKVTHLKLALLSMACLCMHEPHSEIIHLIGWQGLLYCPHTEAW